MSTLPPLSRTVHNGDIGLKKNLQYNEDLVYGNSMRNNKVSIEDNSDGRSLSDSSDLRVPEDSNRARASSFGNRTVGSYYKHLERFNVPRTQSWVDLKGKRNKPPTILKPLKIIRPKSKAVTPKWIYGNPWKLTEPKHTRGGHNLNDIHIDSVTSIDTTELSSGDVKRVKKAGDKRAKKLQTNKVVWKDEAIKSEDNSGKSTPGFKTKKVKRNIKSASSKVVPLDPLPSLDVRKTLIQTRGNRTCGKEENSDVDDEPKTFNRNIGRKYSIPLPNTIKRSNSAKVEVMTINHDEVEQSEDDRSTLSFSGSINKNQEIEVNEENKKISDKEDSSVMSDTEAAEILESVFINYLADEEEKKTKNRDTDPSHDKIKSSRKSRPLEKQKRNNNSRNKKYLKPKSGDKRRRDTKLVKEATSPQRKQVRKNSPQRKPKVNIKPPNSRLYPGPKPKVDSKPTETIKENKLKTSKKSSNKVEDKNKTSRKGKNEKTPPYRSNTKKNNNQDSSQSVSIVKKDEKRKSKRDHGKSDKDSKKEESANDEEVVIEDVEEEKPNDEVDNKNSIESNNQLTSVPKRLFTDFSDDMALDILNSALEVIKIDRKISKQELDRITEETVEQVNQEQPKEEDANFDQAIDDLVTNLSRHEIRNYSNHTTTVENDLMIGDINLKPNFNFVNLSRTGESSISDHFKFEPEAGPVLPRPPKPERRKLSYYEKVNTLRKFKESTKSLKYNAVS